MGTSDMKALESFLSEFVDAVTGEFPGRISYIRLHGSGARGDFHIGESDIDLIVGLNSDGDVPAVEESAFRIFWRLGEKHGLQLASAHKKKQSERVSFFFRAPKSGSKPFVVAGPSFWTRPQTDFFSRLDPVHGFSKSLFSSGRRNYRYLYGESRIPPRESCEPGVLSYDFLSALMMAFLAPIFPNHAYVRSLKAAFFSIYAGIPPAMPAWGFSGRVLYARKYPRELKGASSYPEMVLFCLEAPPRILWRNIISAIGRRQANGR